MEEIWKDIEGYEGLYQVSNMGRVKSVERMKWSGKCYYKAPERILKPRKNGGGYLVVMLSKNGKVKTCRVHRLVATAFIPNPNNLPQINHIDENKGNNHMENLEWCDSKYNNNYGTHNKRVSEKLRGRKQSKESVEKRAEKMRGRKLSEEHKKKVAEKLRGRKQSKESIKKRAKKMSKPLYSINKESGLITYWESINDASRHLGISPGGICDCLKGKHKSIAGYYWHYANSEEVVNE